MQITPIQTPLIVAAVGARVGIATDGLPAAGRHAITAAWADARLRRRSDADVTVRTPTSADERQSLSDLSSLVTHAAISARRGELWMLHAAGLAAPDGGVVVLVGRSGAGKTTATKVLGRSLGYVSDETIGIEEDGTVHPYRKPLSVITPGERFKLQHPPRSLGLLPLPSAKLHVRRIILLDRDPDTIGARLSNVPLTEALVTLSEQSSALAAMPTPLRTMASLIRRTGGVLRASYAEAHFLTSLLDDIFTGETCPADAADAREATVTAPPVHPAPHATDVRYRRRSDVVDWCTVPDDQIAVLTSEVDGRGTLRILGPLASALWRASDGSTRYELMADLPRCFAEPDHAVDFTLSQLVEAGLLTVDM
ncbi:energy-coupling factor transporter ATP-binding protein EcfA2 [Microbacterium sp. SORGH_AS 1204]|uniref:hypothetical protein n=1 Tax=Microbacterium sp. SORGH_AS_1204 TaxID=3041785 RepID=UPI0027912931|nr:hypothetical protein [Microbacterium sp. SORGH_AS_1204]MDQ1137478.1 energy-coupling factor transporter ATP-binding protein EcfA2 [Microbacterium sp. SORGH_AS_1204]